MPPLDPDAKLAADALRLGRLTVDQLREALVARDDDGVTLCEALERRGLLEASDAPGDRLDEYGVLGTLGAGGMGEVLLVHDEELGRALAAKVCRDASRQAQDQFLLEAQVTGQLEHPGIIPVHRLGIDDRGRPYYTMKRVEGRDLAAWIAAVHVGAEPAPPLRRWIALFARVCDAISFAHVRGAIHCDIKPANVMVGEFGETWVLDWGLAQLSEDQIGSDIATSRLVRATVTGELPYGTIRGTPEFMAPEQARGEPLEPATDVYSLGALLYTMLALVPPFEGRLETILVDVADGKVTPPSQRARPGREIPWELEAIVMRAMSLRRSDRYPTVAALLQDVERWLDGRTLTTASYGPLQRLGKWIGRHRAAIAAVGAVLLATLLTAGVGIWQAHNERASRARSAAADAARALASIDARVGERVAMLARGEDPWRDGAAAPAAEVERAVAACWTATQALDRARRLQPDDPSYVARRRAATARLGWVALLGGDHNLARQAFASLVHQGVAPARIAALRRRVDEAAGATGQRQRERLRALFRTVARPDNDIGVERLALRAMQEPPGPVVAEAGAALARLAEASKRPGWSDARRREARLGLQLLTWIGGERVVEPLAHFIRESSDEDLLFSAGVALCESRHASAMPHVIALGKRFGLRSQYWRNLELHLKKLPMGAGGSGELSSAVAYCKRATERLRLGNLAGVIDDTTRALKLDSMSVRAYHLRGQALVRLGRRTEARRDLDTALTLRANSATYTIRGDLNFNERRMVEALSDYDNALKISSQRNLARLGRARTLIHLGRPVEALVELKRLCQTMPKLVTVWTLMADAQRMTGLLDQALFSAQRALQVDRTHAQSWISLGVVHFARRDMRAARAALEQALAIEPRNTVAIDTLGMIELDKGRLKEALNYFEKAAAISPHVGLYLLHIAEVTRRLGDPKGALARYDRALELGMDVTQKASALINRGAALRSLGRHADALKSYERAIEARPRWWVPRYNRAAVLSHLERYQEAVDEYGRVLAVERRASIYHARAVNYTFLGKLDDARRDLRTALELRPKRWQSALNLAELLIAQKLPGARALLERARRDAPAKHHAEIDRKIATLEK